MTPLRTPSLIGPFIHGLAIAGGDRSEAAAYLSGQPGAEAAQAARIIKAAVGALAPSDVASASKAIGIELGSLVRGRSIISAIPGQRPAPFRVRVFEQNSGARAVFLAPGQPAPVHTLGFDAPQPLAPAKIATICVQSGELFRAAPALADSIAPADLAAACAAGADAVFLDHTAAPTDDTPGGIGYACLAYESAGSTAAAIDGDLRKMLAALTTVGHSLRTGCWLAHARTAAYLSTLRSGDVAAYPGARADGGTLLGLPLLASPDVPVAGSPGTTTLTLLVGDQVRIADDGTAAIDVSRATSLQMNDAPTQNALTGGGTSMVSLYQSGGVAIMATRWQNWRLARSDAAVVLENVAF